VVAVIAFDVAVNSGPGRARQYLKYSENIKDPVQRAYAINEYHRRFYRRIGVGKKAKFLKGWLNRAKKRDAIIAGYEKTPGDS
jgi:hypothetical protein